MFKLKRIYEPVGDDDGYRVLVDALWPRGLTREKARLNEWLKEIAPSAELRQRFHKQPELWEEFSRAYREELAAPAKVPLVVRLQGLAKQQPVTLLYASSQAEKNNATVLFEVLRSR